MISEHIQCTGYNVGISCVVITTVHVHRTCILSIIKLLYSILSICNSLASVSSPRHPRCIITHRSTKATAFADQGEQLLQGLRASDFTD